MRKYLLSLKKMVTSSFSSKISLYSLLRIFENIFKGNEQLSFSKGRSKREKQLRKIVIFCSIGFVFICPSKVFSSAELNRAMHYMKRKNYSLAAQRAYDIVINKRYKSEHSRALFILGKSLTKMDFNQSAVYFFLSVTRKKSSSKDIYRALENLYDISFRLGDESALKYALSKINIKKFPKSKKDLLYYRLGEVYLEKGDIKNSIASYGRVPKSSALYTKARYNRGLIYSQIGKPKIGLKNFTQAVNARRDVSSIDIQRVGSLLGRARALYQMGRWNESVKAYKKIPRNSYMWHEALFESTWSFLRSGRFRSAMSNFQSLHSKFYNSHFSPESFILRAIVYLYICKYEEVEKVLRAYNGSYGVMRKTIFSYLKSNKSKRSKKNDIHQMNKMLRELQAGLSIEKNYGGLPGVVLKHISKDAPFKKYYRYLGQLYKEKELNNKKGSFWRKSALGRQINKLLDKRIRTSERLISNHVRKSLIDINRTLNELSDQTEFIKIEIAGIKTEKARKKLREIEKPENVLEKKRSRDFYIKNGYEYWPFQGEYWLDEIGNYQYVGVSQCSQ